MPASWHTYNIAGEVPNCHSKTNPDITEIAFYGDQVLVYCDPNSNDFTDFIRQVIMPHSFSEAKNHSVHSPCMCITSACVQLKDFIDFQKNNNTLKNTYIFSFASCLKTCIQNIVNAVAQHISIRKHIWKVTNYYCFSD